MSVQISSSTFLFWDQPGFEFPQKEMKWQYYHSTHIWGDDFSLPPVEMLAGGSAAIFNLIDDDSFGTNPEENLSL